jgi:O-antigen/teichoic acid export membrane protein
LPVVVAFIIGGRDLIVILFGKEFRLAYVPLIIICTGQLISSISGSVGLVLTMTGNQRYFTNNNLLITAINFIICIPFVMYFDVLGAALVYSILLILQNVILLIHVKSKLNINTTIF